MITTAEFLETVKEVEQKLEQYSSECKEGKRDVKDWNALFLAMNSAHDILQRGLSGKFADEEE